MSFKEDQTLWKQLQRKETSALKRIFFAYHDQLVNRAFHLVNDKQVAEELVQDLFMTLWEKAGQTTLEGKLENYLMASIRNRSLNYLKSRFAKQRFVVFEERYSEQVDQPELFDLTLLETQISRAINQLPAKCREIFLLSRRHNLTYQEIADKLDISKKTVETQIGIALKKLRAMIPTQQK
ncbi:MAG: RNA polymerase sigma-70 factor [Bacteroidota bacterium]